MDHMGESKFERQRKVWDRKEGDLAKAASHQEQRKGTRTGEGSRSI